MQLPDPKSFLSGKSKEIHVFFILSRIFAIFASSVFVGDIDIYQKYAQNIIEFNLIPYKDFAFSYPPLSLLPITLSGAFLAKIYYQNYLMIFLLLMLLVDVFCLLLCRKFCLKYLRFNDNQINYMTLLYSIFGAMLFALIYQQLDIVAAFIIVGLLYLGVKQKEINNLFALSLVGFFYKISVIFILPLIIINRLFDSRENWQLSLKEVIKKIVIYLILSLFIIFAIEWFCDDRFLNNIGQLEPINLQSLYGSILLLLNLINIGEFTIIYSFDRFNIVSGFGFIEKFIGLLAPLLLFIFYAALFLALYTKKDKKHIDYNLFLESCLIGLMILLSFSKVLQPQFFILSLPLLSIYLVKLRSKFVYIGFLFIFIATFYLYHFNALDLAAKDASKIIILCARNFVMLFLTANLVLSFFAKIRNHN